MTIQVQEDIVLEINRRLEKYLTRIKVRDNDGDRQNSFRFVLNDSMIDGTPIFSRSKLLTRIIDQAVGRSYEIHYNNTGTIFNLYEK